MQTDRATIVGIRKPHIIPSIGVPVRWFAMQSAPPCGPRYSFVYAQGNTPAAAYFALLDKLKGEPAHHRV